MYQMYCLSGVWVFSLSIFSLYFTTGSQTTAIWVKWNRFLLWYVYGLFIFHIAASHPNAQNIHKMSCLPIPTSLLPINKIMAEIHTQLYLICVLRNQRFNMKSTPSIQRFRHENVLTYLAILPIPFLRLPSHFLCINDTRKKIDFHSFIW